MVVSLVLEVELALWVDSGPKIASSLDVELVPESILTPEVSLA